MTDTELNSKRKQELETSVWTDDTSEYKFYDCTGFYLLDGILGIKGHAQDGTIIDVAAFAPDHWQFVTLTKSKGAAND